MKINSLFTFLYIVQNFKTNNVKINYYKVMFKNFLRRLIL